MFSCTASQNPCRKQVQDISQGGKTLAALRERGTLRVGFSKFAPWAIQDVHGEWIGFELDVIKQLTKELDLEPELVPVRWAGIIDDLLDGKFDIIIGGMIVNPERAERVKFSMPYQFSKTVLLLNRNIQVTSLEQLNRPQYRFSGIRGYASLSLTELLFGNRQIVVSENIESAAQYLASGQSDAMLVEGIEARISIKNWPDSLYIPDWGHEIFDERSAFALPQDVEGAWIHHLNHWIKEKWENGFFEERYSYWFGSLDWQDDYQLP